MILTIDNHPEQEQLKWILCARAGQTKHRQAEQGKYTCLNVDHGLAICSDGVKTRTCETNLPDGVYAVEQEPDRLVLELEPDYKPFTEEELMNTDCTAC